MYFSFYAVLFLAFLGLALASVMERFIRPKPNLQRPLAAWGIHIGLYFLIYGLLVLILARPYFSFALSMALILTLVLINNTKLRNLGESLTAQDYEFITDIIMYPRLFLPYFGVKKFMQAASCFVLALVGFFYEPVPPARLAWSAQGGAIVILLAVAGCCLVYAYAHTFPTRFTALPTRFKPLEDMQNLGLFATLWVHGFAMRAKPNIQSSPFITIQKENINPLPHLLAIQSESFFDPRPLASCIRPELLEAYDLLCAESVQYGDLQVPAFGGNTVRTEFSFLTGLSSEALGAHRFNPYVVTASGYEIPSLPLMLKKLGYNLIFIHPYVATFYKRDKVFKHWKVDTFLDATHFSQGHRYGPYISDISVAKTILQLIKNAQAPTCIFTITMENHGPLQLESVRKKDIAKLYNTPPPEGFDDMTVYLRHLRHADGMLSLLHKELQELEYPASFCWYGDHVPVMPKVYDTVPNFEANTNYIIWNNKCLQNIQHQNPQAKHMLLPSHELATVWLNQSLWVDL